MPLTAPKKKTKELAAAGLKAFFRIADRWQLTPEQQQRLLGARRSTFFHWRKQEKGRLPQDTLERISYVLGIYKALQILLPEADAADAWVKKPNTATPFQGKSALDRMLQGQVADLYHVRQYLDAQRGDWY